MEAVFLIKDQLKPTDVVVALFPDHGSRYLGKIYNEEWMKQQGYVGHIHGDTSHQYSYNHLMRVYRVYRRKYGRYIQKTLKLS